MSKVFLGIGTNIGDRTKNLTEAVALIGKEIGNVTYSSSVYETAPWGFSAETDFLNMVIEVETMIPPSELMSCIMKIESELGRVRTEVQYSSRIIDIDILFYDDKVIESDNLRIPHPLLQERRFVLVPLCEISPELVHPVLKLTVSALLNNCEDRSRITVFNQTLFNHKGHEGLLKGRKG